MLSRREVTIRPPHCSRNGNCNTGAGETIPSKDAPPSDTRISAVFVSKLAKLVEITTTSLDLGRERFGLAIADIAGKGIGAALLMANLQANLRSQCALVLDQMQNFLQSVNQLFYENTTDTAYATFFFAEYDDQTRCLTVRELWASLPSSPSARQQFGATASNVNRARAFRAMELLYRGDTAFPRRHSVCSTQTD